MRFNRKFAWPSSACPSFYQKQFCSTSKHVSNGQSKGIAGSPRQATIDPQSGLRWMSLITNSEPSKSGSRKSVHEAEHWDSGVCVA